MRFKSCLTIFACQQSLTNLLRALPGWLGLGLLCFLLGTPWHVQADGALTPWNQLSSEEQGVLKPYSDRWGSMSSQRQNRLKKGANRWNRLHPDEKLNYNQRFKNWEEMPPGKRSRIRERYQQFRNPPPEERERIHRSRQRFKNLPPERRENLKSRWRNMPPERKQQFRERRQRMRSLPPQERLRRMNPEQRSQLHQEMRQKHKRESRLRDASRKKRNFTGDNHPQRTKTRQQPPTTTSRY